jgi:hypothetical protein
VSERCPARIDWGAEEVLAGDARTSSVHSSSIGASAVQYASGVGKPILSEPLLVVLLLTSGRCLCRGDLEITCREKCLRKVFGKCLRCVK